VRAIASQCSDASITAAVAAQQVGANAVAQAQRCRLTSTTLMSATAVAIVKWRVGRLCTRHGHCRSHPMPYPWHMLNDMASIRVDQLHWRLVDAIESNDTMKILDTPNWPRPCARVIEHRDPLVFILWLDGYCKWLQLFIPDRSMHDGMMKLQKSLLIARRCR